MQTCAFTRQSEVGDKNLAFTANVVFRKTMLGLYKTFIILYNYTVVFVYTRSMHNKTYNVS